VLSFCTAFPDIAYSQCESLPTVNSPLYSTDNIRVSQTEFALHVAGTGSFYVREGKLIEYCREPEADEDWLQLYLDGQVLVALLHQRKIINFHASSFIHGGQAIMILGETCSGKTSLTASFALNGAGFLTDDLTPVIFSNNKPQILPLGRKVKIREDTIVQLDIDQNRLSDAERGTGKKYLELEPASVTGHSLDVVFRISIGDVNSPEFTAPSPAGGFELLRSEICSWEMLAGMPETEADYLQQLVRLVETVRIVEVVRPADIRIHDFHAAIEKYLNSVSYG